MIFRFFRDGNCSRGWGMKSVVYSSTSIRCRAAFSRRFKASRMIDSNGRLRVAPSQNAPTKKLTYACPLHTGWIVTRRAWAQLIQRISNRGTFREIGDQTPGKCRPLEQDLESEFCSEGTCPCILTDFADDIKRHV